MTRTAVTAMATAAGGRAAAGRWLRLGALAWAGTSLTPEPVRAQGTEAAQGSEAAPLPRQNPFACLGEGESLIRGASTEETGPRCASGWRTRRPPRKGRWRSRATTA